LFGIALQNSVFSGCSLHVTVPAEQPSVKRPVFADEILQNFNIVEVVAFVQEQGGFFCFGLLPHLTGTFSSQLWLHLLRIVFNSINRVLTFEGSRRRATAKFSFVSNPMLSAP
jgi:hypothetical protein